MKIKNFEELAVTDARRALLTVAEAGLAVIDTETVLRDTVRLTDDQLTVTGQTIALGDVGKLVFIAIGKCAANASVVMNEILGSRITRGVAVDVVPCPAMDRFETFCGTHPLPSDQNLAAAEAIVNALQGMTERDLVIFIISGGGSTFLFLPENRANREETTIFTALTDAGATIQEINVVRKHLSLARGGQLAKDAYPAKVISLIFSDVPGNDIGSIASGPTVQDATTMEDAASILARFNIQKICPIENCGLIETPKEKKYFDRVSNLLVVSNELALQAMQKKAEEIGFGATIKNSQLVGEAADVAAMVGNELHQASPKSVLLWGGETTVTVRGGGSGGRNLTVSAIALRGVKDGEEILSLASDGRDHGLFAGAICDTITKDAVAKSGIDLEKALADNDTYPLFEKAGNYVMTGDTGSNVSDLIIALKND
jgi:glycerate-2-kinase